MENTSGQGKSAAVPSEIDRWNWGAFLLNWIWGLGNKTYIALLCFIPIVNLVMVFVLGVKGSEWAWKNKHWDSVEHFKRVQKKWAYWGLGIFILALLINLGLITTITLSRFKQAKESAYVAQINIAAEMIKLSSLAFMADSPSGASPTGLADCQKIDSELWDGESADGVTLSWDTPAPGSVTITHSKITKNPNVKAVVEYSTGTVTTVASLSQ